MPPKFFNSIFRIQPFNLAVVSILAIILLIVALSAVARDLNTQNPQTSLTQGQAVEINRLALQSNALLEQNDWIGARPVLEQLCKLIPNQDSNAAGVHCNLAISCMNTGETKKALREFQAALAMDPHDASIARGFASYYLQLGDTENGKLRLQKCIDIAHSSETALVSETSLVSEAKSTLATLLKPGAKPGSGDKTSADYLRDLTNGKGARWLSGSSRAKNYVRPKRLV